MPQTSVCLNSILILILILIIIFPQRPAFRTVPPVYVRQNALSTDRIRRFYFEP